MNIEEERKRFKKFALEVLKFPRAALLMDKEKFGFQKTEDCFRSWCEAVKLERDHAKG